MYNRGKVKIMDGKTASRIVGITYGQLNLWVNQIDGLLSNPSESQGLPRNFTYRDLVLLNVAKYLRHDGCRMEAIRKAIKVVSDNWKDDDPENAGWLLTQDLKNFSWKGGDEPGMILEVDSDKVDGTINALLMSNSDYQRNGVLISQLPSNDGKTIKLYIVTSDSYNLRSIAYEVQEKAAVPATSE